MSFRDFVHIQQQRFMRLPNYFRAFGLFSALRLIVRIERSLPKRGEHLEKYSVRGYPFPIYLRYCVSDHAIFWQCLVMRQYDISIFPQTRRLLTQYHEILRAGRRPVIIDAGGNIGLAAVWFAKTFPEAFVISVEPDADNFALLQRNAAPFAGRVHPVHGAVTNSPGFMRILNPQAGPSSFQVIPSSGQSNDGIPGFTIPMLLERTENGNLFIVKIDIEGGQEQLFSTDANWVDDVHLIIIEIDDWQFPWAGSSQNFFKEVSRRKFDYLLQGENLVCFRHL